MRNHDISEKHVLAKFDFGFGPEAMTLWGNISLCEPCLEHDGRYRRAAYTGWKTVRFTDPNLCKPHYESFLRGQEWDRPLRSGPGRPASGRVCEVDGCDAEHYSKGRCRSHYEKARRAERKEEVRSG